jgi:hypothetical protein
LVLPDGRDQRCLIATDNISVPRITKSRLPPNKQVVEQKQKVSVITRGLKTPTRVMIPDKL